LLKDEAIEVGQPSGLGKGVELKLNFLTVGAYPGLADQP